MKLAVRSNDEPSVAPMPCKRLLTPPGEISDQSSHVVTYYSVQMPVSSYCETTNASAPRCRTSTLMGFPSSDGTPVVGAGTAYVFVAKLVWAITLKPSAS